MAVRCPDCHELHEPQEECVPSSQEQLPLSYPDESSLRNAPADATIHMTREQGVTRA